ncbi:MAG: tRNA dihydrouridine synthase DusB [Pseudomonadota bacterium]
MLQIGDIAIKNPVLLAPMAGITDRPFRELVAGFGAGLVVSEMVATREVLADRNARHMKTEIADAENSSVQIAGREAFWMAEAARLLEGQGARIIDINMGCPARKVTSGAAGSALMRDPDHALSLIDAVVGAVDVPVTLKMRLGWDDDMLNAPEIARRAEAAGVQMITVHGRTRCQFYKGKADWRRIGDVANAVGIPVAANGDVCDLATARQALTQSGADAVMIGRAARGKPWLLAQVAAGLTDAEAPETPCGQALSDLIIGHFEAQLSFYGIETGLRSARKHLDAYLSPIPGARPLRDLIVRETNHTRVISLIRDAFANTDGVQVAERPIVEAPWHDEPLRPVPLASAWPPEVEAGQGQNDRPARSQFGQGAAGRSHKE